jgi:hypothetical protein
MNAQISGLLPAARQAGSPLATRARSRVRCKRHMLRRVPSAKNSTTYSLADIDMLLWIRHLSLTAAPRRQYPDL